MRKKVIIKEINDIVNLFNDNSRAVRDSKNKSEAEIMNLITNNKVIQKQAGEIDARLCRARDFADLIEALLDSLDDALLLRLREKYQYKTSLIDEIGQLHDKCNDKIKATDEKSAESLKKIDKILAKLEGVSPLNNPTPKNATPKMQAFIDKVQKLLDRGQKLRDKVQRIQDELNDQDQKLKDIVQPVQELKEREVGTKEIK
jgi:seryl-tRNA synthetase